jgi:hypothetical protein
MKIITVSMLMASVLGLITPIHADTPKPLRHQTEASIAGAKKLYDHLAGSIWTYDWKKGKVDFGFDKSGKLLLNKDWEGCTWRVISPNEAAFEWKSDGRLALLTFSEDLKTFKSVGWDGQPSIGTPTDKTLK